MSRESLPSPTLTPAQGAEAASPLRHGMVALARHAAGGIWERRGAVRCLADAANALWSARKAVAALELAMLAPVLMLLTFGFIATNVAMYTWAQMFNSAQYAALIWSTGSYTQTASGTSGGTVACSSVTAASHSTQVEYYACSGLPSWGTYTAVTSENCSSTPQSVTVTLSGTATALADTYGFFNSKTITTQTVMMKQGSCP